MAIILFLFKSVVIVLFLWWSNVYLSWKCWKWKGDLWFPKYSNFRGCLTGEGRVVLVNFDRSWCFREEKILCHLFYIYWSWKNFLFHSFFSPNMIKFLFRFYINLMNHRSSLRELFLIFWEFNNISCEILLNVYRKDLLHHRFFPKVINTIAIVSLASRYWYCYLWHSDYPRSFEIGSSDFALIDIYIICWNIF